VTLEGLGPPLVLPPLLDLVGTTRGVVVLTSDGQLLRVRAGLVLGIAHLPHARALLGVGATVWVAAGEELLLLDTSGALLERHEVGFEVSDLTRDAEGLWLLDVEGRARRVDGSSGPELGREVTLGVGWALDHRSARLVRLADGLRVTIRSPLAGLEAAVRAPDGGLLVVAAGSLHLCDARGRRRVAQGGFGFAVSAAPAAASAPR